ncbi:MAG: hypothetical protein IKU61_03090, partial [Clostridia bacterium]|nr:hypothetical protein [Clostridia bacterium]
MDNSYATRQLTLQRGYNFIGSAVALLVIVDGLEVAKLKANEKISVSIPANSREIFFRNSTPFGSVDSTKYLIPAGNGNLICEIKVVPFKNDWSATFRQDNCAPNMFEQQITDFTVEKFRRTEVQSFL